MTGKDIQPEDAAQLRRQAEKIAQERAARWPENPEALSPEETRRTLHELQVHQIELEMQNEELRRAHVELDALRARYFDLYDLAPVGYFSLSEHGLILEANLTAADLLGVARSALARQPLPRLIFPEDEDIYYRFRKQLLETGRPQVCELRMLRANAAPFWARLEASAVEDGESGEPVFRAVLSDIDDMKRGERELRQAKAAAEAANEAKGQFLANISHELRTPMNAILGMVDLALPKLADSTAKDLLETARESADLLLTLLNDLLDSAKIESGGLELESGPFSLRRVLNQTTQVLAARASEKGLAFSCDIACEAPDALVGDQVRLRQILLNLAGNAIKFTESGEITVGVRISSDQGAAQGSAGAGQVMLECAVRDTGIGIPPSDLDRIFHPFAQADGSTTRRYGGTGLGLAICSSLVRLMGGRIWVESQVGKGSTFHFTVRLSLAKELLPEPPRPKALTAAPSALRILLVEDNPANQKFAAYILGQRGHTAEIAGDGHQALSMAQHNHYDVILMDVQMPGMDGLEATQAIRTRENGQRRVPIIAMTAHAMKGDRDLCLAAGMDGYLAKPVDGHEMIALVESCAAPIK